MHDIIELPAWERLFKKSVWKQLGDIKGKKMDLYQLSRVSQIPAYRDIAFFHHLILKKC